MCSIAQMKSMGDFMSKAKATTTPPRNRRVFSGTRAAPPAQCPTSLPECTMWLAASYHDAAP